MNYNKLIGRLEERSILEAAFESPKAEMVSLVGCGTRTSIERQ